MGAPTSSKIHHQPYFLPTIMQLLKRAANGNYSKLLETTIANYHETMNNLYTVRGIARAFTINSQLCAFYGVYVPSAEQELNEQDWLVQLRDSKPKNPLFPDNRKFAEVQLMAYMSGAIDYILELPGALELQEGILGKFTQRFYALHLHKTLRIKDTDFLTEMWAAGLNQQRKRFEGL